MQTHTILSDESVLSWLSFTACTCSTSVCSCPQEWGAYAVGMAEHAPLNCVRPNMHAHVCTQYFYFDEHYLFSDQPCSWCVCRVYVRVHELCLVCGSVSAQALGHASICFGLAFLSCCTRTRSSHHASVAPRLHRPCVGVQLIMKARSCW